MRNTNHTCGRSSLFSIYVIFSLILLYFKKLFVIFSLIVLTFLKYSFHAHVFFFSNVSVSFYFFKYDLHFSFISVFSISFLNYASSFFMSLSYFFLKLFYLCLSSWFTDFVFIKFLHFCMNLWSWFVTVFHGKTFLVCALWPSLGHVPLFLRVFSYSSYIGSFLLLLIFQWWLIFLDQLFVEGRKNKVELWAAKHFWGSEYGALQGIR